MARGSKNNFVVDALQTFRLDRLRRYSAAWYGVPHDPEAFAKTVANNEPKSGDVAMMLAPEEAALFYRAWWPLLTWVNEKKRLVPSFPTPTPDHPLPVNIALHRGDDSAFEAERGDVGPRSRVRRRRSRK